VSGLNQLRYYYLVAGGDMEVGGFRSDPRVSRSWRGDEFICAPFSLFSGSVVCAYTHMHVFAQVKHAFAAAKRAATRLVSVSV
jgi:hypothetical protein